LALQLWQIRLVPRSENSMKSPMFSRPDAENGHGIAVTDSVIHHIWST